MILVNSKFATIQNLTRKNFSSRPWVISIFFIDGQFVTKVYKEITLFSILVFLNCHLKVNLLTVLDKIIF